jgi:hypothetical protein
VELDLLVIGSGPSGQKAAIQAAKLGKRVGVAERRNQLGGVSIHTGTIPSKTLRQAVLEQLATRPLDVLDPTRVEETERQAIQQLLDRAGAVVAAETGITREQFRRNHVGLLPGDAVFEDDHTIRIDAGEERIRAERIVIAVGTRPARPASVEFDDRTIIDSDGLLKLETRVPRSMCETVEIMLQRIMQLYESADEDSIRELAKLDDRVDRKHAAIKVYLAKMTVRQLSEDEALRCQELVGACVKLEQVGDIIVRNMLVHVRKKLEYGLDFTPEGWRELTSFHATVLTNARLAFNVLVSRDPATALQLVREKDRLRDVEKASSASHFARLGEGTAKSIETSSIHLDTIRDLKQINSLLASMAYPVLEEHGLLGGSRLKAV